MDGLKISQMTERATLADTDVIPVVASGANYKATVAAIKTAVADKYYEGNNTVTAITAVPTTKRLVIANISASASLAISGTIAAGAELHIIVNNTGSSKITVTIPSSKFTSSVDTIDIESKKFGEINIVSNGTTMYLRAV